MAPVDGHFVTDVLPSMILLGIGAGIAFNPVLLAAMGDVEPHEAGLASGVVNTSFMMGGALGLAVLVAVSDSRTARWRPADRRRSRRCTAGSRSPSRSAPCSPPWPRWSAGCSCGRSRWRCPSGAEAVDGEHEGDESTARSPAPPEGSPEGSLFGQLLWRSNAVGVNRTVSYNAVASTTAHPGHCRTTAALT